MPKYLKIILIRTKRSFGKLDNCFIYLKKNQTMLKKSTQYALWGLVYTQIQNFKGDKPGTFEIADSIDAPRFSVAKTFQILVRHGLIFSLKGKNGGFYFDQNRPDITLMDVIVALGEKNTLSGCILGIKNCSDNNPCLLHSQWSSIRIAMENMFATVTVQSLAKNLMNVQSAGKNTRQLLELST